jgi:transcription termination factor Rho
MQLLLIPVYLIVLLIDERPEEVTLDSAEKYCFYFDREPQEHVKIAIVLEKQND